MITQRNVLGDSKVTLADIKEIALMQCAEIGNTAATGLTKIACSNMTTYAKTRYKGKLVATTLAELIGIDKIFYKFHNKAIKNMPTFPYDLIIIIINLITCYTKNDKNTPSTNYLPKKLCA